MVSGGKCLISWKTVCRPKELGGLGITNVMAHGRALRMRWLWQSWTDNNKAWAGLELPIDSTVKALFNASVDFQLGNGERILFWKEPWFKGGCLQQAFPPLFKQCTRKNLTVAHALGDGRWVRNLKQNLPLQASREFLALWEGISNTALSTEHDQVRWRWTANGIYTAKSAYLIQFEGCTRSGFADFVWNTDAPGKCKLFAWLAMLGRCNNADILAKKGWPHNTACSLCAGPMEDAVHLLATCPFTLQIWQAVLRHCSLPQDLAPFLPRNHYHNG